VDVPSYQITLKDRSTERIDGADAYQQEGQMTTFFQTASGRTVVDTWSTRLASFRTSEVLAIRRLEDAMATSGPVPVPGGGVATVTGLRTA
jgi:hypothetical protein